MTLQELLTALLIILRGTPLQARVSRTPVKFEFPTMNNFSV